MTTTKSETPEVTISVSQPYRVVGFQGGRYGASQFARRDYTADVMGKHYTNTSKSEIQSVIRGAYYRATGSNRVRFTFVQQEG